MIKSCGIHWMLVSTGTSGEWDELFTLEGAENIVSNLNVTDKNTMKYKHWFEFEDVTSNGEGLEFADEQ